MGKIHIAVKHEVEMYARHMSIDAAARKVKVSRLNRVDFVVDEVVKKIKAAH